MTGIFYSGLIMILHRSGMQVWSKQTYGDRVEAINSPTDNLDETITTARPSTTILKTGRAFEPVPTEQEFKSSSCSRVPVSKLSLLVKESMPNAQGSTFMPTVSRYGHFLRNMQKSITRKFLILEQFKDQIQ